MLANLIVHACQVGSRSARHSARPKTLNLKVTWHVPKSSFAVQVKQMACTPLDTVSAKTVLVLSHILLRYRRYWWASKFFTSVGIPQPSTFHHCSSVDDSAFILKEQQRKIIDGLFAQTVARAVLGFLKRATKRSPGILL